MFTRMLNVYQDVKCLPGYCVRGCNAGASNRWQCRIPSETTEQPVPA